MRAVAALCVLIALVCLYGLLVTRAQIASMTARQCELAGGVMVRLDQGGAACIMRAATIKI